jgi:hypothetical protein
MKHMRATHHFITVFSLLRLNKRKRNSEKHTGNIFGVFGFSKKVGKTKRKGEKQKREKLFTRESSQQAKEEQGNLFGFSLNCNQLSSGRKTEKKKRIIFGFSESFSNTQKESKKIKLERVIQWKRVSTDN